MNCRPKKSKVAERYVTSKSGTEAVIDTIDNLENENGSIRIPNQNSIGIALEKKNSWTLAADIYQGQWSQFRKFGVDPGLKNSYGAAIGYDIIPNSNAIHNYFKLMNYRIGLHYGQSNINLNNTAINEYGLSIGFGIPLIKSGSKINIAFDYLSRGTSSNGLIKEDLFNVSLGLLINDKWFRRYKFE